MSKGNISVLGVGRLGISFALCLERAGYNVLGNEIDPNYVEKLNNKTFLSEEPLVTQYLKESKNFKATLSLDEALEFSDNIWVLVATPTGIGERIYDISTLSKILDQINDRKISNKHIYIGCTVLPGYIAKVGRFLLRDCKNVTLNYNPEFIAQGDIIKGLENPDVVLIGEETKESGAFVEEVYKHMVKNQPKICRMSAESAEICKLAINCFVTTKISFANMVSDIADNTPGANPLDILNCVGSDSRVGLKYLLPGYGYGGPCFPRDNRALGNYATMVGIEPHIPVATDEYNKYHARVMADKMLKQNLSEYVFEDVCYKPKCPVTIIEESQKLEVAKILAMAGKKVIIKDRVLVVKKVQQEFGSLFKYEVIE